MQLESILFAQSRTNAPTGGPLTSSSTLGHWGEAAKAADAGAWVHVDTLPSRRLAVQDAEAVACARSRPFGNLHYEPIPMERRFKNQQWPISALRACQRTARWRRPDLRYSETSTGPRRVSILRTSASTASRGRSKGGGDRDQRSLGAAGLLEQLQLGAEVRCLLRKVAGAE